MYRLIIATAVLGCGTASATAQAPPDLPRAAHAAFNRSVVAFDGGRYDEAIRELHNVHEVAPRHPAVLYHLAAAHDKAGRPIPALAWLEAYAIANPNAENASTVALEIVKRRRRLTEQRAEIMRQAARALDRIDRTTKRAEVNFESAVRQVIDAYIRGGSYEEARATLMAVRASDEEELQDLITIHEAWNAALQGRFAAADEAFGRLKDPEYAVAGYTVGTTSGPERVTRVTTNGPRDRFAYRVFWARVARHVVSRADRTCWDIDEGLSKEASQRSGVP